MYIGTFLPPDESAHFTPWMRRPADNAVFTYELISNLSGSDTLVVEVFEKDSEDPGPGTFKATINNQIGTSRLYEEVVTGLKELVRYRVSAGVDEGAAGVIFRILPPNWFNTIEA